MFIQSLEIEGSSIYSVAYVVAQVVAYVVYDKAFLWLYLGNLKTNHSAPRQYLRISKTNHSAPR